MSAPTFAAADLSVALCTHNGAAFVAEQVRSILDQQPAPRELVVGDDASSDGTIAVIERTVARLRAENPALPTTLRILRGDAPLGVTRNFERTIAECTSALVALSDQDDIWPPGRLARILPLFGDAQVQLVHTDARLVDVEGRPTGVLLLDALEATGEERAGLQTGAAFAVLLRRNLVTGATAVVRTELARRAMPFPPSWVHDEWLAAVASVHEGVRLVAEPLLDYRQHGGNQIGASAPTWQRRLHRLREPRDSRSARLIARAEALVAVMESDAGPSPQRVASDLLARERLTLARAKAAHERRRAATPRWQPLRVPAILWGVVTGRYRRFSRGPIDVLRDLVQPATAPRRRPR